MAKKSKKRRKVLAASCILAALIVAGSSFAWFTSKDEVTNRLSATTDYGVAIAENFQPPENWVPGQTIAKDAAATNTGNVDAFVRMYLDGSIRTLQQQKDSANKVANYSTSSKNFTVPTTAVTDDKMLNADLTLQDAAGNYYKTLDVSQTQNPSASVSTDNYGYSEKFSGPYSEVQAMQTGILAYAPDDAEYTYVLNEETPLKIWLTSTVGDDTSPSTGYRYVNVPKGTLVHVGGTVGAPATLTDGKLTISAKETVTSTSGATNDTEFPVVYVEKQTHNDGSADPKTYFTPVNVEYESFTPLTDGLYLFLRNENDADQTNPEFSGYYRSTQNITDPSTNNTSSGKVVYYALNTNTPGNNKSDYTVKGAATATYAAPIAVTHDTSGKNIRYVTPSDNLELFTAKYIAANSDKIYWYYTAPNTSTGTEAPAMIHAVYHPDGVTGTDAIVFDEKKDIVVDVALANIYGATANAAASVVNTAESWTPITSDVTATNKFQWETGTDAFTLSGKASDLKFYYDNDLESGDTSAKLVDYVVLNKNVTNKAFLGFDFDLGVHLDSVQVTYAEDGTESALAVGKNAFTDGANANVVGSESWKGASGEKGGASVTTSEVTDKEISKLTWEANNNT